MKAFEKWDKTIVPDCLDSDRVCPTHNKCEKCERGVGWCAALEYIKEQIFLRDSSLADIKTIIEQELEEE